MLTLTRKFPALLFALLALVAVSCNTNEDPVDPSGTKPNMPTSLKAQSLSSTSVGLKWDAPAGGVTPTGYTIYHNIVGSSAKTAIEVTGASSTNQVVSGLAPGTMYEFTVQAVNGSVVGDATAALTWAPAYRSGVIRMYSSRSTNGSGLIVFDGNPRSATVSLGGLWDLAYDDQDDPARPKIASPGFAKGYVDQATGRFSNGQLSKITYLGRQYTDVNDLNDIFETEDLNDDRLSADKEAAFDLSSVGGTKGMAFVFANKNATVSPNTFTYGKVLVMRNGGNIIQGSGDDKYIEVVVSYQTATDVPYALRAKLAEAELRATTIRQESAR